MTQNATAYALSFPGDLSIASTPATEHEAAAREKACVRTCGSAVPL